MQLASNNQKRSINQKYNAPILMVYMHVHLQKMYEMKFDFLRVICNHEHFIPLNLPFAVKGKFVWTFVTIIL